MILIKNGLLVDGTGRSSKKTDILVSEDKISAIGNFPNKKAAITIDALGMTVMPGFIDPNTDSDHHLTLFSNPSQKDFLLQGVTTSIGGHCGASLAPLLYGSLESIRKWADVKSVNVGWHEVGEFLQILENRKLGVNFGMLIGASTIRRALIGEDQRDLTERELEVFKNIVLKGIKEGALGLSTGLGYAHSKLTPFSEIKTLTTLVAGQNGVWSTHLRDEEKNLLAATEEVIKITKITGVKTLISHLRPLIGFENQIKATRQLIAGLDIRIKLRFDSYPFDTSMIPLYTFLPAWAKRGNLESMWSAISDPQTREEIKKALPRLRADKIIITFAPGNNYLVGKRLAEFALTQEVSREEALLRLMQLTRLRALLAYKNIRPETAEDIVFDERAFVGSNGVSLPDNASAINIERSSKTFTKFLSLAVKRKDYSLENAVQKITAEPAEYFGLRQRGIVKEGYLADLAISRNGAIEHTIVNGEIAVKDGIYQNILSGKILKKSS